MALYNHVTDKNDLITGIVDHILNGIRLPAPDASWQWRLRGVFTGLRQLYLDHPDLVPLIQASTTISAAQLRPLEAAFEALVDAGLSLARAREAWTALISLTNGHVAYQLRGHFTRTDASTQGAIESAGDFPRLTAALTLTPSFDHDSAFETALDALIHGLTDERVAEPAERRP
jgi:TetR/AcrR family transcriptional regulator, tetracycline repressor protein